jgi:hypothetical protein
MEDTVTDLETQLRDCLSRHADTVFSGAGLSTEVRNRSHQLARKRHGAVVFTVVPLTAAAIVGGISLSGSSSHPQRVQVRPLASSTPSATPAKHPVGRTLSVTVCPKNTVPKLRARNGAISDHVRRPTSTPAFIRHDIRISGTNIQKLATINYLRVVGHRPTGPLLAIETVHRNGRRDWTLNIEHSPDQFTTYKSLFLGCAPRKAH